MALKYELLRKLIHISTLIIPLSYYYFLNKYQTQIMCGIIFGGFFLADILRINITQLTQIYEKFLGNLLRPEEKGASINGATLLLLGFFLAVLLFDQKTAVIVMLILSVSDSLAAIIGKRFGKIKIMDKTAEGSASFFIISFVIAMMFNDNVLINFMVALTTTLTELLPINDNISIPLAGGITFMILQAL